MYDYAEEIIDRYIELEKKSLDYIDNMEGSDAIGTIKWRLRETYEDRLKLLEDLKKDIIG